MKRIIKKIKRCKAKSQKHKALYSKWLARELDVARALRLAYYNDEKIRNAALEILREYGLSAGADEDEYDTKTS